MTPKETEQITVGDRVAWMYSGTSNPTIVGTVKLDEQRNCLYVLWDHNELEEGSRTYLDHGPALPYMVLLKKKATAA